MPRRKQTRRTTVKDARAIPRLTFAQGRSAREVAERLKVSKSTVSTYLPRPRGGPRRLAAAGGLGGRRGSGTDAVPPHGAAAARYSRAALAQIAAELAPFRTAVDTGRSIGSAVRA